MEPVVEQIQFQPRRPASASWPGVRPLARLILHLAVGSRAPEESWRLEPLGSGGRCSVL